MIPCANPGAQFAAYREEIAAAMLRVADSGWYINGKEVEAFQAEFAAYVGTSHAVGVASGTDAIRIALLACGIGAGDEVITVSHTAVATVAAIELAGATPVLVDIDPATFNMDPARLEAALTPRSKAVVLVHLYGGPAALEQIQAVCRRHGLRLIEDCAQAHGARHEGRRLGAFGDMACFSFYPTKNLGALGDGGMVVTGDGELAQKALLLREYGWRERYVSEFPGMNSRLDELQAAILRTKLKHLDEMNAARVRAAGAYGEGLAGLDLALPQGAPGHVYHLYVVRTPERARLIAHLKEQGVQAGIHYPQPVHRQPAYAGRVPCGELPETEKAAAEVLSLPMFPELETDQVAQVVAAVREFHGAR